MRIPGIVCAEIHDRRNYFLAWTLAEQCGEELALEPCRRYLSVVLDRWILSIVRIGNKHWMFVSPRPLLYGIRSGSEQREPLPTFLCPNSGISY